MSVKLYVFVSLTYPCILLCIFIPSIIFYNFCFKLFFLPEFTIWIIGQLVKILSHDGFSPLHGNSIHSQTCLLEVLSCQNAYIYDCAINDYSKFITSNELS